MSARSLSSRAFTVSDAGFFAGTVALLNSLAITGNPLPLTVLDRGLTAEQRRLIELHCEIVPYALERPPWLCKLIAPMASDADVVVVVDSDILVTDVLTDAIDAAARGSVYAFSDEALADRSCTEWTDLLGLRAPLRNGTYLNAGFVAVSRSGGSGLCERWAEVCDRMAARGSAPAPGATPMGADPVRFVDQDALNALVMSEVPASRVVVGPRTGMVMQPDELRDTQVVDADRLRCVWRGEPVTMLHAIGRHKPWQRRAAREFRATAYTRCLLRALTGPDLVVRIPEAQLVPWLRSHLAASAVRGLLHAYDAVARPTRPARHRMVARVRPQSQEGC